MWGGDAEQQADWDAGNHDAVNWQDMAERAVETAVSIHYIDLRQWYSSIM